MRHRPQGPTDLPGYLRLAKALHQSDGQGRPFPRATVEEFALDSFENVLFSIIRFFEYASRWPDRITVVVRPSVRSHCLMRQGFGFKRLRYETVHRVALRWGGDFEYVGIDKSVTLSRRTADLRSENEDGSSLAGERTYGLEPFQRDPMGCHDLLLSKRRSRNPFRRIHPYHTSAPELAPFLEWCPDDYTSLYPGRLPWRTT